MTWVATAIVGSAVIGGVTSAITGNRAADKAASAQIKGSEIATSAELEVAQMSIDEQKRQFDEIQKLLSPYVSAGGTALTEMMNLTGLGGYGQQKEAISALEQSPQYKALIEAGETGILQNASATGGLRGGNIESALMEYRPSVLSQLIESQYSKLRDITGIGQASAAGTAQYGANTSSNVSNLLMSMGASRSANAMNAANANAQAALASGQATSNAINTITGSVPLAIYAYKKF